MNILFVTSAAPRVAPFFMTEKRPPLGIGSMIAVLRKHGHQTFFIDNYLKPENFIEDGFLQTNSIDCIGIQANTVCYRDTLRMCNSIEELRRQGHWKGKIVVGGPHTTVAPRTIPDFVDHIVLGEGENAIIEIVEGRAPKSVTSERIKDLDFLPFQPWDLFNRLPYDYSCPWIDAKPVYTLYTSRGCPFKCTFCSSSSIWGHQYTYFSPERILAEIDHLVSVYHAAGIYFREDNFTLNRNRTESLCQLLLSRGYGLEWACESRIDTLCDEQLIKLMSASGCRAVYLGVESGSQRVLDTLSKGITVEQVEQAVGLCKRHGIRTYCSLMVGVPGETYEDYRATVKLIERIKPYSAAYNVFVGMPGSALYGELKNANAYEHIDYVGLMYLPGFDVRAKFFYNVNSSVLVEHTFRGRTELDRKLAWFSWAQRISGGISQLTRFCRRVVSFVKRRVVPRSSES